MKRTLLVLSAIACLVLTSAGSAGATKPVMQKGGDTVVDLHFPAGTVCSFPLDVHQEMKVKFTTFVDADGNPTRSISTGRIHDWETNADTGETQFHSISGPSFFDATGALVWGTGSWSGVQLQDGTWVRTHGLIRFDANLLLTEVHGRVESLCDSFA